VAVEADKVQVKMDRGPVISTLEIEVEIPNMAELSVVVGA
jgi:septum formation topological specificity factor MinE